MTQLSLSTWSPVASPKPARPTIEQRFAAFHAANPHVFSELLRLARARLDAGATFVSSKALYEECRVSLRTQHGDGYKLNNDYTPTYARLLLEAEPRLVGVIELRTRMAK